ncbi:MULTISPECIES: DUF4180 domain-containing protein [Streptomyces]|uniref:DUF4180 domain-containing protein n=2 Tax=Streptomyces TaxID=1883 RepID=A0AA40SEG2_9ACTN|nr:MULTISPECIES: DUF4180 domain-containing protein [Streptomyces]MBA8944893.1 hypothetical protein [Streptomyces calvus]MBA8979451.1 hypothetical protein [Streptomyces calvus]MYS32488.1 DUF4180 domain-containing protein [Streptomyces sp. SID7804]
MAADGVMTSNGVTVLVCDADGAKVSGGDTALDLIGDAMGCRADVVAVPVERLADEFFALSSGVAGDVVQKFVNYRIRLAVVGDIGDRVAASDALRDFVREANRGRQVCFVADRTELEERLARA